MRLLARWGRAAATLGARARLRRAVGRAALGQAEAHGQAVRVRIGRPAKLRGAPHRLQRLQPPAPPRRHLRASGAARSARSSLILHALQEKGCLLQGFRPWL